MANFVDFIKTVADQPDTAMLDEFVDVITSCNNPDDEDHRKKLIKFFDDPYGVTITDIESYKLIEARNEILKKIDGGITPKY